VFACDLMFGLPQSKSRDLRRARFRQFTVATRFDTLWAVCCPTRDDTCRPTRTQPFRQRRPWIDAGWASSENPEMPDLPDLGRALQDQLGDVFGQECARLIGRYVFYELRLNVDDEFVRLIFQTVLVADAVIHDCPDFGGRSLCAPFYQRVTRSGLLHSEWSKQAKNGAFVLRVNFVLGCGDGYRQTSMAAGSVADHERRFYCKWVCALRDSAGD
jgi:hypothetical protein